MPLYKHNASAPVSEIISYTVTTGDAYGAQLLDVKFYNEAGEDVTPTSGDYDVEWSPNGRGWSKFTNGCKIYANDPISDVQSNGYTEQVRLVPNGITGASTWTAFFRFHGIGDAGINTHLLTSPSNCRVSRIPVDSQQTSFEANEQFRFHMFFSDMWGADIPALPATAGTQLVLKFSATNPVNIILRNPEVYLGGFVYRVWPDTPNVTFDDGLLTPLQNIFNINGNLRDSRLSEHPTSGVTISYAVGQNIFRSTDKSPNGTVVVTDGNQNTSTNEYSPNDVKSGVAAGRSFYLVFDTLSNQLTKGMITIAYEERF